jgi:hypothetical protein
MRTATFCAVAGSVIGLALLAGCGEPDGSEQRPDIATLRTGSASAAPPSTAVRERPVIRPDEGRAEFDRYVAVWEECLTAEGVPAAAKGAKRANLTDGKGKAAAEKCAYLYPENWMEREARTNPEYLDRLRETARCLVGKGHEVTVGGDPVALMYGDNTSANRAYDDEQQCQRQAFRKDIKKYEAAGS